VRYLFILNDPPYGTERCYNGLRHARALLKRAHGDPEVQLRMFLLGDAVVCAKAGQKVPQGYYSTESMLKAVIRAGGEVGLCGTCLEARGLKDEELIEGARHSTIDELSAWTVWADKVITY
jgi:uncharacterized protein involved in oxidation of intracellular sulfur